MIHVAKSYATVPVGLTSQGANKKKAQLMLEGNKHEADGDIYAHATVREALNQLYGNKCAYCERLIEEQADRRVDHYRPRKARDQGGALHPGPFWLTYERPNLLLSCRTCNLKKSNLFPVSGTRVTAPPALAKDWDPRSLPMQGEKPLLLNPEIDQPNDHLDFSPDGQIHPRNDSPRGTRTIEICGLNRDELTIMRKKRIDGFCKELQGQVAILAGQLAQGPLPPTREAFDAALELGFKQIVENIKTSELPAAPFSRVGQCINEKPDQFLLAAIPEGRPREVVRKALERFLV